MTNTKRTSPAIASLASKTLQDIHASQIKKSLAAPVLAQVNGAKQTGAKMEQVAANAMNSTKYALDTKTLAASVLSQSNRRR